MELSDYDIEALKLLKSTVDYAIRLENSLRLSEKPSPLNFWVTELTDAIKDRKFEDDRIRERYDELDRKENFEGDFVEYKSYDYDYDI